MNDRKPIEVVREHAARFGTSPAEELRPVLGAAGNARLVLIGEASHGTHELYRTRAE